MKIQEQIESFYRFARQQIDRNGAELTIDELFDAWRYQRLSEEDLSESVAAVQAALQGMKEGDTARPLEEVIAEIRAQSKVPPQP